MATFKYSRNKLDNVIRKETGSYGNQEIQISDDECLDFILMSTKDFTPAKAKRMWEKEYSTKATVFELVVEEEEMDIYFE